LWPWIQRCVLFADIMAARTALMPPQLHPNV
jgi:hypothetical protein